jgi:hypothetical protein
MEVLSARPGREVAGHLILSAALTPPLWRHLDHGAQVAAERHTGASIARSRRDDYLNESFPFTSPFRDGTNSIQIGPRANVIGSPSFVL